MPQAPTPGDEYHYGNRFEVVYHVTDDGHVLTLREYDMESFVQTHDDPDGHNADVADLPPPSELDDPTYG